MFRVLILVAALFAALPQSAAQASPTVTGAGSTWSQVAVDQWRADVSRYGLKINYQGVGSSAGRQYYIQNQADFAVSEIPFEDNEVQALRSEHKSYEYLPIVAGGTSLMYNLRDAAGNAVRDLRLSSNTIAKIFTRVITNWNDPQITADNGGRALPSHDITVVVRSDGSGTSAQFSMFLWKRETDIWCKFAEANGINPCRYTSNWPPANGEVSQSGSDGVANYVHSEATGQGAITYVETAYALQRGRPVAAVKNASGNYTLPTSKDVSIALTKATLNADHTQNLDQVYVNPAPETYPISSYSYMIAQTKGFPTDKGAVLGKFMLYFACTGQRKADQLGYSPLPPNLVQVVFDAERQIPGAPAPPKLSDCDNPTIKGGAGSVSNSTGGSLGAGGSNGVVGGPGSGPAGSGGTNSAGSGRGGASGSGSGGGSASFGASGGGVSGSGGGVGGGANYSGGAQAGQGANGSNQALPDVKLSGKAPTWLPFAMVALLVLALVFVPPAFAITAKRKELRR